MSLYDCSISTTLTGLSLVVLVGCGAPADDMPASWEPPPPGITGTGADNIPDPALRDLPNPNPTVVTDWGRLPDGRVWGSTAGADTGPDGTIWAYDRCGNAGLGGGCDTNLVDPIINYDPNTGELLTSFGAGVFVTPHGIHVDRDGNVWVTDFSANEEGTKGHQVIKFSPEGEILMRLGTAGVAGNDSRHFNQPCDVITSPNGDIFVADGHSGQNATAAPPGSTGRIMKFSPDGEFIMEWGHIGNGPGEFRTPHAMAFDSQGRLYVADRGNHRIQIFDQDGNYIDEYYEYSRISDLFITDDDVLYAIDSETEEERHPGWMTGIRIGSALEDRVTAFIPPHHSDDRPMGVAGEGVTVDADGNVYAAEGPGSRPWVDGGLTKYVVGM
jgi:sugar lactone lactonase YvrE